MLALKSYTFSYVLGHTGLEMERPKRKKNIPSRYRKDDSDDDNNELVEKEIIQPPPKSKRRSSSKKPNEISNSELL